MPHLPTDPAALDALREPTEHHPWRVLVSGCMLGRPCSWQGDDNGMGRRDLLQSLLAHPRVTAVGYCPEELAIGTPRGIPDIHGGDGFDVLDGRAQVRVDGTHDVTQPLLAHAREMAELAETCDLALLVDISATCGSQIIAAGDRSRPDTLRQSAPGLVAALLWERRIPFASHRDDATLARLAARLDRRPVDLDNARDHHEDPWVLANLPDAPWSRTDRATARRDAVSARRPVYKILDAATWAARDGEVPWAPIDEADGFLHLSAADQVERTLALHFAGRSDLVRVQLDAARIRDLVWEPSRGGQLFPHVYGPTPLSAVVDVVELPSIPSE